MFFDDNKAAVALSNEFAVCIRLGVDHYLGLLSQFVRLFEAAKQRESSKSALFKEEDELIMSWTLGYGFNQDHAIKVLHKRRFYLLGTHTIKRFC